MDTNRFAEKAQEAILSAQKSAQERSHTQIEVEHLLIALVSQEDGVVPQILGKLGVDLELAKRQLESDLEGKPKVYGPTEVYMSQNLKHILDSADYTGPSRPKCA